MANYNVKKIESTNTMTTTLTTSCKKRDTAISRFCRFLSEYDSCFKDSMLLCTMKIEFIGYVDNNVLYQATVETDEYYMTYTECGDIYQVIIEFKHDENTTYYKSLANVSVSDNDTKDTESDTNDTKDTSETTKSTVTIDIGSLDDVEIDLSQETAIDSADNAESDNITPQPCYIKVYYDGKELSVPYSTFKCVECAIEYITALYKNHVVSYDTVFILKCGSQAKEYTIHTTLDTPDLIQYNIDDINNGFEYSCYKAVRECFKRLCNLIDDSHKCIVSLVSGNNTHDFVILKSRFEGLYTFKSEYTNKIQSPESFARWLYYRTFTHEIVFKYWHTIKEGETK